ncbi:hypothetical protein F4824DRAFT_517488 [Ustulina deusta]|nr:hypothetical protein F4824DRAFT_517488 [Ustulina deusta]
MNSPALPCPARGLSEGYPQNRNPNDSGELSGCETVATSFDDYVGKSLQGKQREYHIKPSCWNDGDLIVFPAISDKGESCEGQFFKKCELPRKLYLARKRRIQRLRRSNNFMDELDLEGVKIIVSRVPKDTYAHSIQKRPESTKHYTYSIEEFPPLCPDRGAHTPGAARP